MLVHTFILSALAALSAAEDSLQPVNVYHGLQARSMSNFLGIISRRQSGTCPSGYTPCGSGCMPNSDTCCAPLEGSCSSGSYCSGGGCCAIGQTCSGPTSCPAGKEQCGTGCMVIGNVCCSNGHYCFAGQTCSGNTCLDGGSGNNTPLSSSTTTPTPSPTPSPTTTTTTTPPPVMTTPSTTSATTPSPVTTPATTTAPAAQCPSNNVFCDSGCMPSGYVCCNSGQGNFCQPGAACVTLDGNMLCSKLGGAVSSPSTPTAPITTPVAHSSTSFSFTGIATSIYVPGSGANNRGSERMGMTQFMLAMVLGVFV